MNKRTELSKATYNHMAAEYDTSPEGVYTRAHKAELIKRVPVCSKDSVLDVACGNGTLLGELSNKAEIYAYGVDLSENMIAAAKMRYPNCSFTVGSCVPLCFENESMDFITVSCAFHHFEKPYEFAVECMRVLKKGGVIFMAEPFYRPVFRWMVNHLILPFMKSGDVKAYSAKELCAIFKSAGFVDTQADAKGSVLFFCAKKQR